MIGSKYREERQVKVLLCETIPVEFYCQHLSGGLLFKFRCLPTCYVLVEPELDEIQSVSLLLQNSLLVIT